MMSQPATGQEIHWGGSAKAEQILLRSIAEEIA